MVVLQSTTVKSYSVFFLFFKVVAFLEAEVF